MLTATVKPTPSFRNGDCGITVEVVPPVPEHLHIRVQKDIQSELQRMSTADTARVLMSHTKDHTRFYMIGVHQACRHRRELLHEQRLLEVGSTAAELALWAVQIVAKKKGK